MMGLSRIKPQIHSLRVKITLRVVLIVLLIFAVADFFSSRWITKEIEADYKEKAVLMGMHIIHDLGTAMVARNHEGVSEVLDLYRGYKGVEEVRVFGLKGEEKFSQGKGPFEPRIGEVFNKGGLIQFPKELNKREVTSFVFPMKNDPPCQRCHGKSEAFRGALLLSLNREQLDHYINEYKQQFFILFSLLALGIIAATILSIRNLFLGPLGRIQKGAEEIGKGNYRCQVPITSKDEIADLANTFNLMAQSLLNQNRKLSEQFGLISKSQKEWQETFDCITDPILLIDRDCTIIKANRAFHEEFKEDFAFLPSDPINKKCSDLFGTCLESNCPHRLSLQERRPVTAEVRGPKSGKLFETSIFPYETPEGEFIGSVVILKDITDKRENELRRIMEERLRALGEMASGIAHEINNPLATISAGAEGLLKRLQEGRFHPRVFEDYLGMIKEEVDRTKNLTSDMLSFVRKGADEKKEVDIHKLLDKTLEMIGLQGRLREVEVLRHYQEALPLTPVNEGELRQVFLSIITNALDAMEEKGRLTLATGFENKSVFIKINDTGPGIPPEIREKIFTPFFTTKSEKGGTGLGLSIAKKIIEENEGKIEFTSEDGKGTTYNIILPM